MTLLDFARGPALSTALAVFAFGVLWRLVFLVLLPRVRDRSAPRASAPTAFAGMVRGFARHLWPRATFAGSSMFTTVNGYVMHLGLFIVFFGLAQHMLFLRGLFGVQWPNLPSGLISAVAVITLASLGLALGHRLASPVLRLISTFNDYFSWLVTTLPIVTGLLAVSHLWAPYETLLAVHLLSVALLLVWFPFGKLMHAFLVFVTRSQTGVRYSRRGVVT
ncbi:MAG: nitrate reductase [Gammaproteobacteria bacterium]|nr:nitrate reductase [Gammaproteobacteria bacterium]